MPNIFVLSDTHFGHGNILKFIREDGSRVRNFSSVEEMDEHMVQQWNSVVRPQDKVYHLGDVTMNRKHLDIVARLNGHKRLVRGNHDLAPIKEYLKYFDDIYGVRVFEGEMMILSHIPLHMDTVGRFRANVHGHVHNNLSALNLGERYVNVSVEVINYTPVPLEVVKKQLVDRGL